MRDICQWLNQCIQQSLSFDIFLPNQILSCRNQLMYCFQETVATPKKTDIFPKKIFKSTPNLNTAVWATDILQKIFELRNHEKKEHQRLCEKHPIYLICKSTGFYLIGVLFTNELRCLYRLRFYYTWKKLDWNLLSNDFFLVFHYVKQYVVSYHDLKTMNNFAGKPDFHRQIFNRKVYFAINKTCSSYTDYILIILLTVNRTSLLCKENVLIFVDHHYLSLVNLSLASFNPFG